MIPPLAPIECQVNGPTLEPRRVTVVLDELTAAPNLITVPVSGQARRHAYTD
jgi:hypothetical protein